MRKWGEKKTKNFILWIVSASLLFSKAIIYDEQKQLFALFLLWGTQLWRQKDKVEAYLQSFLNMQDYFHQFTCKQASLQQHWASDNFWILAQHYHEGIYNETHTRLDYKHMLKIYTIYK